MARVAHLICVALLLLSLVAGVVCEFLGLKDATGVCITVFIVCSAVLWIPKFLGAARGAVGAEDCWRLRCLAGCLVLLLVSFAAMIVLAWLYPQPSPGVERLKNVLFWVFILAWIPPAIFWGSGARGRRPTD